MAITLSIGFEIFLTLVMVVLYFYLKNKRDSPQLARVPLLVGAIYAFVNVEGAKDFALVYIIFLMAAMLIGMLKTGQIQEAQSMKIGSKTFEGGQFHLINYGIGFFMLGIMVVLQTLTSGLVIGVPLAANGFGVIGSAVAAFAENHFFTILVLPIAFTLKPIWQWIILKFEKIPLLGIVIASLATFLIIAAPILVTAYLFGIFHATAYAGRVAAITFAASVMILWLISYKLTKSTDAMDVAHVGWNVPLMIKALGGF